MNLIQAGDIVLKKLGIILLFPLVIVHELGHYLPAKLFRLDCHLDWWGPWVRFPDTTPQDWRYAVCVLLPAFLGAMVTASAVFYFYYFSYNGDMSRIITSGLLWQATCLKDYAQMWRILEQKRDVYV